MAARSFAIFFLSLCFQGCASDPTWPWNSQKSQYDNFVEAQVRPKKIFNRGRVLVNSKILQVTSEIRVRQNNLFPALVPSTKLNSDTTFIVALESVGRDPFTKEDLQISLHNQKAIRITEIDNLTTLEALYSFAYPYMRVFEVEFGALSPNPDKEKQNLEILIPMGRLEFDVSWAFVERST